MALILPHRVADVKIVHEVAGTGPPLLLIQGLGYARWGWEPVAGPLAETYQVITFDNRVVDVRNATLLAERVPGARLELLPGLGHLFFWDDPERTVARVEDFLGA